jgi:hypothetical protein
MPENMTPNEVHVTAQWIIETALAGEEALKRGDTESVAICFEALATYAKNIFDATNSEATTGERRLTQTKRLYILNYYAERFLQGTATGKELESARYEAAVAGCDDEAIRRICEMALDRVVAAMRTAEDTNPDDEKEPV